MIDPNGIRPRLSRVVETLSETRQSDEQLASEAAREGSDGPAFTELASRFRDRVWRICFQIMGHSDDAADAAQDVLVRMFLQRTNFEGRSKYSTWVHGIAVRTCLSLRRARSRRQKRVAVLPGLDLDTTGAPPDNPASPPTDALNLDEMLNTLGDEDRALVVMKYSQDHSYQELSQIFGLSESACKMRVSRAVGRLRERHGG